MDRIEVREGEGAHRLTAMIWAMQRKRWRQARRGIYGTLLALVRVFYFLKGARMGYGSEDGMLRDRAGMEQEALKALSVRTGDCGQGT